jgi:hypothetical protein
VAENETFPMLDGPRIPMQLARVIFAGYNAMYGGQTLERIGQRGGFGWVEVPHFWSNKDGRAAINAAIAALQPSSEGVVNIDLILQDCEQLARSTGNYNRHADEVKAARGAVASLRREVDRLTKCLGASNAGFENYERLYYLERDKSELTNATIARVKALADDLDKRAESLYQRGDRAEAIEIVRCVEKMRATLETK